MVGMIQIVIFILCVYLVFKGVEIFQIAFVSSRDNPSRSSGIAIGVTMIILAICAALIFISMEENMAERISDPTRNLPNFNR